MFLCYMRSLESAHFSSLIIQVWYDFKDIRKKIKLERLYANYVRELKDNNATKNS